MALWALRHEKRRVVPFVFRRAGGSALAMDSHPDIDDRGHRHPTFGPVMGITEMQGDVEVVIAKQIPGTHRIGLTVRNPPGSLWDTFEILSPTEVDITTETTVRLRAQASGADQRDGVLEVRAGGVSGPVVAKLVVRVFAELALILAVHRVQLVDAHGQGGALPDLSNLSSALEYARRIWIHCGVWLLAPIVNTAQPPVRVRAANPNQLFIPPRTPFPEVHRVLGSAHQAASLNIFVVNAINGTTIGIGFSSFWVQHGFVPRRGLVTRPYGDAQTWGNNLAHEIGHVIGLQHPGNRQPNHVDATTFGLRQLMHNFLPPVAPGNWPPPASNRQSSTRARFTDIGYGGDGRGGGFVTMKAVPHVSFDNQAGIARENVRNHPF